jgi:hypothetical protein
MLPSTTPTRSFSALALMLTTSLAQANGLNHWCNGTAWYNSAFGSRHYATENGQLVHGNRDRITHQEVNPGIGVTCYKRENPAASYSLGSYPNSNWGRSDYIGVGYDFARLRLGGISYHAGVFIAAFNGYKEFAPKGLGGLAIIPGYTLTARGEKFGFETKIVTNLLADKDKRKVILGFSWMMRY